MPPLHAPGILTIQARAKSAAVLGADGSLAARLPELDPGEGRRRAWTDALRTLGRKGQEVQVVLDSPTLEVFCQEVPYLTPREQEDAAGRLNASQGGRDFASALDPDPEAEGGHVLWVAQNPRDEMAEWLEVVANAGLALVHATPLQRALIQGLRAFPDLPPDKIVLALDDDHEGRLAVYHGLAVQATRSFRLPEDPEAAEERIFEEVNRILQFFKQKNRKVGFGSLLAVGAAGLSKALQDRLRTALGLPVRMLAPDFRVLLAEGARKERASRRGLNLVPREILLGGRRRILKGVVWVSGTAMVLLLAAASLVLLRLDRELARQADQAEANLALRKAAAARDERIVLARLPLVRTRLAEARQAAAVDAVTDLGRLIFEVPQGVRLERVEIQEAGSGHHFVVTGVAETGGAFSLGPLARYLQDLGRAPGIALAPLKDVSVSDLTDEAQTRVVRRAVTRFQVEGTAP